MQECIYHYTSIESLALTLKNRTIKFNRLDNVDDINETQFLDHYGRTFSQYMFISCWTENSEKNLAFWNMYTPNMIRSSYKIAIKFI